MESSGGSLHALADVLNRAGPWFTATLQAFGSYEFGTLWKVLWGQFFSSSCVFPYPL